MGGLFENAAGDGGSSRWLWAALIVFCVVGLVWTAWGKANQPVSRSATNAYPNQKVWLEVPGQGWGTVLSAKRCPAIEKGEGRSSPAPSATASKTSLTSKSKGLKNPSASLKTTPSGAKTARTTSRPPPSNPANDCAP